MAAESGRMTGAVRPCERSEAIFAMVSGKKEIASSLSLLAMTRALLASSLSLLAMTRALLASSLSLLAMTGGAG